ncbi:MAG: photosynthetic complex putative assembly protein PuhB [Pseudomonadota bacterium]
MDDDDFQPPEPIEGLPEVPPEGERILWQGKPNWWRLAQDALMLKWVAIYFGFIALWQGVGAWMNGDPGLAAASVAWLVGMGVVACAILALFAWVQAWATVYTVTNRRIVMRIGAALTVSLNIPYRWIGSADLQMRGGGTGTIALDLLGESKFSYLMCWPHIRPWRIRKTQPALRCIPEAEQVARLIAQNATAQVTVGVEAAPDASAIAAE